MASPSASQSVDACAIVVAYHGVESLRKTLVALAGVDTLVVDNSADLEVAAAATDAGATYLDSGANIGFARAVNLGISSAGGRDVVLVNPDAEVSARTVRVLVEKMQGPGPRVAAVAPSLVGRDGRPQRVRWPFPSPSGAWLQAAGLGRLRSDTDGFLVGAVLALSATALERVGGFDESFFLYGEETDWQRRAVADGWTVVWLADQLAIHVGGGSSNQEWRREIHFHAGSERYIRKWYGAAGWASYRLATALGAAVRVVALRGDRRSQAARRLRLYLRGPLRAEQPLRTAHAADRP